MNAELLVLRLVHVLGGIFWVGSMIFNVFFLMPALAGVGPAAGPVMAGLQRRRLLTILPSVALLTVLSGIRLMWLTSGGFASAYFRSPHGLVYTTGAVAALIGFLLAFFLVRPAMMRSGRLAQELAANPEAGARAAIGQELDKLRRMGARVNLIVATLLIVAAAAMAVGRYVR